ncbi:MAG: cell division protein SepF [Christensenellales bacterium]
MDERFFRNEQNGVERNSQRGYNRVFSREQMQAPQGQVPSYTQPQASGAGGVVIYSPRTYQDVQLLIDHLRMREQVIVDFSTLNQQSVYRILDFMSGAIYALGGSIQQITKNIFLFAPSGVTITVPPQIRG